jgi:hypothetical protein
VPTDPRHHLFHLVLVDRGRGGTGQHHRRQHARADGRVVVLLDHRLQVVVAHRLGQGRVDAGDVGRFPGGGPAQIVIGEDQVRDGPAAEKLEVQRGPGRETRREHVPGQLGHTRSRTVVVRAVRPRAGQEADVQEPALAVVHRSPISAVVRVRPLSVRRGRRTRLIRPGQRFGADAEEQKFAHQFEHRDNSVCG